MPATGETASSQNGFDVTLRSDGDAMTSSVKSPENRTGIRLAGDNAGVYGVLTYSLSVTPMGSAPGPDPSDCSGDGEDVTPDRGPGNHKQPRPVASRCRQRPRPPAAPRTRSSPCGGTARLKAASCGHMDLLHTQCLALPRYLRDACRPDPDGAGPPALDAPRHLLEALRKSKHAARIC